MKTLYLLALAVLLGLIALPIEADDGRPDRVITVAAYNIENAFDVFDNPYTADEKTDVKQRSELASVSRALRAIDADVVVFSEVENEALLRDLVGQFLGGLGYRYIAVLPTNDRRGINLGLISRLPIRSLTSYRWQDLTLPAHPGQTWRFARDLMHATLNGPDGTPLHVLGVHFKSKRNTAGDPKSTRWRKAEAAGTRRIVDSLLDADPDARVLVAGDFNSEPTEPAMTKLLEAPGPLTDLHRKLPRAGRITYPGTVYPDAIFDYILASPALARRMVPGSAVVLSDPAVTGGSDHRPVYASFDLSD